MEKISIAIGFQSVLLAGYALPMHSEYNNYTLKISVQRFNPGIIGRLNKNALCNRRLTLSLLSLGNCFDDHGDATKKVMHFAGPV